MDYIYSGVNRLTEPHNYMYTKFEGAGFINKYRTARLAVTDRSLNMASDCRDYIDILDRAIIKMATNFKGISKVEENKFWENFGEKLSYVSNASIVEDKNLKKELEKFSITDAVDTKSLLLILIRLHISGDSMSATYWMDRLVQRFEVTKKLYQKYLPGFRKGEGSRDEIVIYWLFAVALSLRAHGSKRLKYLNTLLKVCDLLCSLPLSDVLKVIPKIGLAAVIAAEMTCTQILIDKGKINIE